MHRLPPSVMYQSGKLRSQSPDPAKDSESPVPGIYGSAFESLLNELVQHYQGAYRPEKSVNPQASEEAQLSLPIPLSPSPDASPESISGESERGSEGQDILPFPGISDPEFESLLNDLVQRSQDAFRTQESASPHPTDEPTLPPPIPSSVLPETAPEKPGGESERSEEGHDVVMTLLTILVVGLAMICGMLLGIHHANNRGASQILKNESVGPVPTASAPLSSQSVIDQIRLADPNRVGRSQLGGPQEKHQKARTRFERPGGLTVYQNDRVVFELPPGQDGTKQEPASAGSVPNPTRP